MGIQKLLCKVSSVCAVVSFFLTLSIISGSAISSADDSDLRKFRHIKDDVDAFVKRARKAETDSERVNSAIDCVVLYCEIRTDERFPQSPYLQNLAKLVSSRLNKVEKDLQRQLIKVERQQASDTTTSSSSITNQEIGEDLAARQAMVDSLELSMSLNGGLEGVFERSSGYYGGAPFNDYADDLINLIREVVHPDSWEVNGGTGSIGYYRPSLALVVRATTEVHEDISRLLTVLRYLM